MKMGQIECSEMSAYKLQTLGNYPKESIEHTKHGVSLKSRMINLPLKPQSEAFFALTCI